MREESKRAAREVGTSEAWSGASEAILGGLAHDLSDRITSLLGVVVYVRSTCANGWLLETLEHETTRLQALAARIALLRGDRGAAAEAVLVPDLVEAAADLVGRWPGLEDVPIEVETSPDTLPVLAERGTLTRALVLCLADAAAAAARHPGGVRVRCAQEGTDVVIEATAGPEGGPAGPGGLESVAPWARSRGGRVEVGGGVWRLVLPDLPTARAREREAAD